MDRYALVESAAHFEKAYEMATAAEPGPAADRALIETILDWSILFYYRAILPELDDVLDRHQDAMERLDDERLRMWWLIWRGHARAFLLDHRDVLDYLERALAIANDLDDQTAVAYIETWRGWAYSLQGRIAEAIASADSIIPSITEHREHDPYPYLKTVAQKALTIGRSGRYEEADELCAELISFGERVGNTRCQSMGYQMLASRQVAAMSIDESAASADKAIAVAIDPVYRDSARMVRGLSASAAGDERALEQVAHDLRSAQDAGVRLVMPLVVELLGSLVDLRSTDPAAAFDRLLAIPAEARLYQRDLEAFFAELNTAVLFGRIATGEAKAGWKSLLSSPRLLKYVRVAKREARGRFERLIDEADDKGYAGFLPLIRFEFAKLLIASAASDDARRQLEVALDQVAPLGETEGATRIAELLATV
jgi:tetratricopeptide (TPR) repeat protein